MSDPKDPVDFVPYPDTNADGSPCYRPATDLDAEKLAEAYADEEYGNLSEIERNTTIKDFLEGRASLQPDVAALVEALERINKMHYEREVTPAWRVAEQALARFRGKV